MSINIPVKYDQDQIVSDLVKATYKLIDGQFNDQRAANKMAVVFLARFAGTILYRALTEPAPPGLSKDKIAAFTIQNFAGMKQCVQEAVAAAFSGAMNTYSGQQTEYYCRVRPVPPTANKEPI
jgi:hypothetical protein